MSIENKFLELKASAKLEDEVDRVLKEKTAPPQNVAKLLGSLVFPRGSSELASDKPPLAAGSLFESVSYTFYHFLLIGLFFAYSVFRALQYAYNRLRLRILGLAYSPAQLPQLVRQDVVALSKLPNHIAAMLTLKAEDEDGGGLDGLLRDAAEVCTWTICAGVPELTLFERSGALKNSVTVLVETVSRTLGVYFGQGSLPTFLVRVPRSNVAVYGNGLSDPQNYVSGKPDLVITLVSTRDGKRTIAELARTMAEMAAKKELKPQDVTVDLVDAELTELSGHEPDLLVLFGPELDLQGYPPWQIRLSEIYWEEDNDEVSYVVFLNALKKFATCKINVGK